MYQHYQTYNPHRAPDWRYNRALEVASSRKRASRRVDDAATFQAIRFLRAYRQLTDDREREYLFQHDMGLYYAHAIYTESEEPDTRFVVEARLLAGQTDEEIAQLVSTLPATIEWYHRLFFDVRERLSHRDYIVNTVLKDSLRRGAGSYDFSTKLFGYFGGSVALDHMLYGFRVNDRPLEVADLNDYYDRHQIANLRRRAALETMGAEINRFNVVELLGLHVRLIEIDRAASQRVGEQGESMKAIDNLLNGLQYTVGRKLGKSPRDELALLEDSAAELRADELLDVTYAEPKKRRRKLKKLTQISGQFAEAHGRKEARSGETEQSQ